MLTLYRVAFEPAREPYWIGLLFTNKNGYFDAISATERSCAVPIPKVERHRLGVHTIQLAFCVGTKTSTQQR